MVEVLFKVHARFADFNPRQAAADAEERPERRVMEQEQFPNIQVSDQHAGQGRQFRANVLPGIWFRLGKVGAGRRRKSPGRYCMPASQPQVGQNAVSDTQFQSGDCPEVAARAQRRAVVARAAAVEGRRLLA